MFQYNFDDDKCEPNDEFQIKLKVDQVSKSKWPLIMSSAKLRKLSN